MHGTASKPGAPAAQADTRGADERYFSALSDNRFEIPQCDNCGRHHFFPRVVCPHCGSTALRWVTPSGRGTVYSTTVVRRPDGDYTVCLLDLAEGPRLMSRVVEIAPDAVHIGMPVQARIDALESGPLLVFIPLGHLA
ncbi:Zn-ribbon domain-containing OB-fold protein [Variovorax rhizosphaerae]|uniref:Zn-ribbon domain-containing OB-fold protein n=1 Tax=Variovorax rhizosphaerae TaxID=1836200 RepID=A0ABU8WY08_9BURK